MYYVEGNAWQLDVFELAATSLGVVSEVQDMIIARCKKDPETYNILIQHTGHTHTRNKKEAHR